MKKATSILTAIVMVAALSTTMNGCKKGENDPLISLKSRDGRITGIWELTTVDGTDTDISTFSGSTSTTITKISYDGNIWTETTTFTGLPSNTEASSYDFEITIEKDGTYSSTEVEDGDKSEETGSWWWLDSKKNKSGILIDGTGIFDVDRLKNKELILIEKYSSSWSDSGSFSTSESLITYTYAKL